MKKFNSTLVRVKNASGEYDPMPALQGESAYQVAVRNGFVGSEAAWLESLRSENSYELAVKHGYTGTEDEWLESIVGSGWVGAFQGLQENMNGLTVGTDRLIDGSVTPEKLDRKYAELDEHDKVKAAFLSSRIIEKNESFTLDVSEAGAWINAYSDSSEIVVTVSGSTIPVGAEFEVCRVGSAAVRFMAGDGVVLASPDNSLTIARQYGTVAIKKVSDTDNVWILNGDLE